MHYRPVIVRAAQAVDFLLIKGVQFTVLNIFRNNGHVIIAVGSGLFVPETQRVQEFVLSLSHCRAIVRQI